MNNTINKTRVSENEIRYDRLPCDETRAFTGISTRTIRVGGLYFISDRQMHRHKTQTIKKAIPRDTSRTRACTGDVAGEDYFSEMYFRKVSFELLWLISF